MSLFDTLGYSNGALGARHARQGFSEAAEERLHAPAWSDRATLLAAAALIGFSGLALACWLIGGTVVPWELEKPFLSDVPLSRRRAAPR